MKNKNLIDIVSENYVFGSVLHYFGISFYEYSDLTLGEICAAKGLNVKMVEKSLTEAVSKGAKNIELADFPVDLIIEYLIHSHHQFVKRRLPYIAGLISGLKTDNTAIKDIAKDLQFIFPMFVNEFIEHIYEEEDTLFVYVMKLYKANNAAAINSYKIQQLIEDHTLQAYALDHDTHDDEMQGIRKITNNYEIKPEYDLHIRVIFIELQEFEKELCIHAKIENEIFFPKALALEKKVMDKIKNLTRWN